LKKIFDWEKKAKGGRGQEAEGGVVEPDGHSRKVVGC
jgi:hypothetical protein